MNPVPRDFFDRDSNYSKGWRIASVIIFIVYIAGIAFFLSACGGTITPDHIQSAVPAVDTSTPVQYGQNDNGFIGYRMQAGKSVGVVTENKRTEFNGLIAKYRIQFKGEHPGVWLEADYGLVPYVDSYQNRLWAVDLTALGYYMNLEQWKRDKRPGDSLWLKALEAL